MSDSPTLSYSDPRHRHRHHGLETSLAVVLHYGTWLACAAIGWGLALALIDARFGTHDLAGVNNMEFVTGGIVLFILLPVLRVLLMLVVFLRRGDLRFGFIAALVLAIIVAGFVIGMRMPGGE